MNNYKFAFEFDGSKFEPELGKCRVSVDPYASCPIMVEHESEDEGEWFLDRSVMDDRDCGHDAIFGYIVLELYCRGYLMHCSD